MSNTVTLGGNRLGAGKKNTVTMHGFERSTHDLGFVFRNTQAPGTLVPFMNILALPGDSFDINLGADVKTHPTLGPLFASFKLQLDVFQCPIRLYHAWLHNNKLGIGNNMATVKLPLIELDVNKLDFESTIPLEFQQINQSSLLAYLGIRGVGNGDTGTCIAQKSALPLLSYWDIVKNYYANKQEEKGYVIHTEYGERIPIEVIIENEGGEIYNGNGSGDSGSIPFTIVTGTYTMHVTAKSSELKNNDKMYINYDATGLVKKTLEVTLTAGTETGDETTWDIDFTTTEGGDVTSINAKTNPTIAEVQNQIKLVEYSLDQIDLMRETLLSQNGSSPYIIKPINGGYFDPYALPLKPVLNTPDGNGQICAYFSQEGLAIKTYQNDLFNNWLNTEWIDGEDGINSITAVDTSEGSFDINTLNLAQKVYDMLNRIAVAGGSYDDWMEAVYDHGGMRKAETPMYMGGLSKEIIFNEVVSTAAANVDGTQELGSLAGKGGMAKKHKGGTVNIKVSEPSFIMGIVSITPRIDYYQGNDWTTLLKTMDDLHKPNLDEIGFQDLVTDQMAFWDTQVFNNTLTLSSAGKQPAWINYMTNYNKLYGNFADERSEMYMTLARRYEADPETKKIKDLTTYVDPTKYNYAFAQTDLTAQNFWVQIGADITARRKMSAKLMPNL